MPISYGKITQLFEKKMQSFDKVIEYAYQEIATAIKDYAVEQFDKGSNTGSNDFGSWAPLKPETIKYKEKYGSFGRAPLKTSGKLYEALKNCDKNWTRTSKGIKLYIPVDYAEWQNEGNSRGTPARQFFGTTTELEEKLKPIIEKEFKKHINNG